MAWWHKHFSRAKIGRAELLLQAEYAEFLRRTDLDRLQPEHDIRPSRLGRYDEIWEDIVLHQAWLTANEPMP